MGRRASLAVAVLLSVTVSAEIYRWVDADGKVHFSDKPTQDANPVVVEPVRPSAEQQAQAQAQLDELNRANVDLDARIDRDVERRERQKNAKAASRKIHCDLARRDYQAARTRLKSGGYVDESRNIIEKRNLDTHRAKIKRLCG